MKPVYTKKIDSFYGLAQIRHYEDDRKVLISYGKAIVEINGIRCTLITRQFNRPQEIHIREFLRQNNFDVGGLTKNELIEKYR